MGKSVYDLDKEAKEKHDTLDNTYAEFPIGTPVKIICLCQDHYFFYGETGKVVKNTGQYLGITVDFDEPRKFQGGYIQRDFNFQPADLLPIRAEKDCACPARCREKFLPPTQAPNCTEQYPIRHNVSMMGNEETRQDRIEAAKIFVSNLPLQQVAEFIVSQNEAIDGLTENNRQLAKSFRGMKSCTCNTRHSADKER